MTMTMTISTRSYRYNHGVEPRGRGSWAFAISLTREEYAGAEHIDADDPSIFWAPGSQLFSAALKAAKAEAKRRFALEPRPIAAEIVIEVMS